MNKILVTGGGGFVGKAIVKMARAEGIGCRVAGRNHYPEIEQLGASCFVGDIRDPGFVSRAAKGVDTVFHVAALAGIWGTWQEYYSINVTGTENVIGACRKNGVGRLVHTSTPSVVFNRQNIEGGDERLPYARKFLCHYAKTKVIAEQKVLAASDNSLQTCALRPHLIWGPGDPHLIPRLLQKGKAGQLKQVGAGKNLVDISYIDNVAQAHILAGYELADTGKCAGKAYFLSQGEPVNLWDWINALFIAVGVPAITAAVPFPVAYAAGAILESWHSVTGNSSEPRMTRFLAEQLAKSHYFSIKNIKNDLGYKPKVSTAEGMNSLLDWIKTNETISL